MSSLAFAHSADPLSREAWDRCVLPWICGTIEQTKALWEELDAGGKPLQEALTRRGRLVAGRLRRNQRSCRDLLLRIESP